MTKKLGLLGLCVLFAGCTPPGTRQQPLFSNASQPNATATAEAASSGGDDSGFSVDKMLQFVGFKKDASQQTAPSAAAAQGVMPAAVQQVQGAVNEVAGRAAELNANDPPEVTRQKAIGILDTLQQLDGQLAQGKAAGTIDDQTLRMLAPVVVRVRDAAQRLVQYVPTPQTIGQVQQLAGNLHSVASTVGGVFGQVNSVRQAFSGPGYPGTTAR